ncbi:hypothetical protein MIND_00790900 [Mycena indigotica]|uniref:Uncharacterized protein n=1 Tax=Mycena indigotica TaxID=2126181 RepID=A0A8H6SMV7_9AGAR|nr:uncharacterized protein MIND_00790900 [Mycena indigotica]KAF7302239.1 hypothetical protein MIND_00790900 [Mycena indigotica]
MQSLLPPLLRLFLAVESFGWTIRLVHPQTPLHHLLRQTLNASYTMLLYSLVAFDLFYLFVNLVLSPLLDRFADEPSEARGTGAKEGDGRIRVHAWQLLAVFGGLPALVALTLRERSSEIIEGTYQVLQRVVFRTAIVFSAFIIASFFIILPLFIVWLVVKRLTVDKHKQTWSDWTDTIVFTSTNIFLLLLSVQWIYSDGQQSKVPPFASVFVMAYKWLGLAAYGGAIFWLFCDRAATILLRKGLALVLLPKTSTSQSTDKSIPKSSSHQWTRFVLFPAVCVVNGCVHFAPTLQNGIAEAVFALLGITFIAFYILMLDLSIYQLRFQASRFPRLQYSPWELMGIALAEFSLRDVQGNTVWEKKGLDYCPQLALHFEGDEAASRLGQIFGAGDWKLVVRFSFHRRTRKRA